MSTADQSAKDDAQATRLARKATNRARYERQYARRAPRARPKRAHQKGYGYYDVPLNVVTSREAAYFRVLCFGMGMRP